MDLAAAVTEHFGVAVESFIGDNSNAHWFVRRASERFVLRRYRSARTLASATYEAALVERLAQRGHRVPEVVDAPIVIDDRVWMLMSVVPGTPGTYATDDERWRGRKLAELHHDLMPMTDLGQRDGRTLADVIVASSGLDAALSYYGTFFPEEAHVLQWHVDRARQGFAEVTLEDVPLSVIHGDFTPWNLQFVDGALNGIVDFDLAHLNYRVADFALSWRGKYDGVIEGYNEILPLTDAEWALLAPVRWSWLMIGLEDAIVEARERGEAPDRFEWNIDQMVRRTPLMGRDAAAWR